MAEDGNEKMEGDWSSATYEPRNTFQKLEEASKDAPPEVSERALFHRHLDFGLLVSRTVRESTNIISSHSVFGTLLHHNWETNALAALLGESTWLRGLLVCKINILKARL